MIYVNTNNDELRSILLGDVAVGTKVVFYNDDIPQDIHIVIEENDAGIRTKVELNGMDGYYFANDPDRPCYILESPPTRGEVLFDEDHELDRDEDQDPPTRGQILFDEDMKT